jgi:hypothetical protein
MVPCLVATIGDRIEDDTAFFHDLADDDCSTLYLSVNEASVVATGYKIDEDLSEFRSELSCLSLVDDLPSWLQSYPVQKLLKLTMESEMATDLALLPRHFPGRWLGEYETVFRPRFSDSRMVTQLRPNTIGAHLLRNFVDTADIFEALKDDALEKISATKAAIDKELSKYQDVFDARYGK